jgi:methionyl aminopeptidase
MTFAIGKVNAQVRRLIDTTAAALEEGIAQARVGNRLGDISATIQERVEHEGFSVVREFVGHGIGRRMHEDPPVPNYGAYDRGVRLREGMVLAIEPMVNLGRAEVVLKSDGWTAVTRDGSLSAHFERSVAITEKGPEVLGLL